MACVLAWSTSNGLLNVAWYINVRPFCGLRSEAEIALPTPMPQKILPRISVLVLTAKARMIEPVRGTQSGGTSNHTLSANTNMRALYHILDAMNDVDQEEANPSSFCARSNHSLETEGLTKYESHACYCHCHCAAIELADMSPCKHKGLEFINVITERRSQLWYQRQWQRKEVLPRSRFWGQVKNPVGVWDQDNTWPCFGRDVG